MSGREGIAPALVAGWLLAFTLSLDDLVIASFVSGPGSSTLPMVIFSKVRLGVSPEINALATILVALVAIGTVIAGLILAIMFPGAGRFGAQETETEIGVEEDRVVIAQATATMMVPWALIQRARKIFFKFSLVFFRRKLRTTLAKILAVTAKKIVRPIAIR